MNYFPGSGVSTGRRLWLVRHGESTWNALGLVQGHISEPTLTPLGLRQARRAARVLAAAARTAPVEAVYSSDLERALRTAAPVGRALGLEVRRDPRLRERSLGAAEGAPSNRLGADRSGISEGRVVDADASPEGGESVRELYARASACAAELLSAHAGDLVLVCHGGVVRVLLAWLSGIGPDEMTWPEIHNGAPVERLLTAPTPVA